MNGFGFPNRPDRLLVIILVLVGCSAAPGREPTPGSVATASAGSEEKFRPLSNGTRVFVFPIYTSVANASFFDTRAHNASREARQTPTYRLSIDARQVGTFSATEYVEMDLPPGQYTFNVEEIGWLGTSLRNAKAPVSIRQPGQVVFIAIPTSVSDMGLKIVDANYGIQSIDGRVKASTEGL